MMTASDADENYQSECCYYGTVVLKYENVVENKNDYNCGHDGDIGKYSLTIIFSYRTATKRDMFENTNYISDG